MISVKIKICGITSIEDAVAAVSMGADILGFNFYPKSPRYITAQQAFGIISKIPAHVDTAAVFVNADAETIGDTISRSFFNWIQLHGDETTDFCRSLRWTGAKIIKAIRIGRRQDVQQAGQYPTNAVLLDAKDGSLYGGTGKKFDWSWVLLPGIRIFLAGGINPDNAASAVAQDCYGIDVCSGVESQPGKKDHEKMRALFRNINAAIGRRIPA